MDSVRTALRLGAKDAMIVYRRSEQEMPARREEVHHAKEEGVRFELQTAPVRVIGDENGWVKALECVRMDMSEPDESGRRRPIEVKGSNFELEADVIIVAVGTGPNPLVPQGTKNLVLTKRGYIEADENGKTSRPGVYAGGDIVTGSATVISAMGAGRKAAAAMQEYLSGK
jgi:glutamate synthase (NADPH/NADH) small chain